MPQKLVKSTSVVALFTFLSRIMGFLLVCIGVQFVINGILDIVAGVRAVA